RVRLRTGETLSELETLEMLSSYGIPTIPCRAVESLQEALDAAVELGWPVALKTAAPGITHKTDVGGVFLRLDAEAALERAYADLSARLGPRALVAAMARPGIELALGVVRDAQFGPLVMVAAGGALIEVLRDRAFGLAPLDDPRARELIESLAVSRLLEGVRGSRAADTEGLVRCVVALARLATDLGEHLDGLDVNPLVVGPEGCVAVDGLALGRSR
ncbi:MAG TPA: acetate--CoA ligase family protein, partial [Actinomycetota bacterium]|nr:acetate--CoA ligase family protein [Actinomycetota bacterium]